MGWFDNMRTALTKQYSYDLGDLSTGFTIFSGNCHDFIGNVEASEKRKAEGVPPTLRADLKAVATQCNDSNVHNLIAHLLKFPHLEYLNISHCGITDHGIAELAGSLGAIGVKTLVLGNNPNVTQDGRDIITKSLVKVPHEIFVSWLQSDGAGTATFKDTSHKTHDLKLEPDSGGNCMVSFSSISGVSAGDSVCPAPVKDQIVACLSGAAGFGGMAALGCVGTVGAYPVCVANAALVGCGGAVIGVAVHPCISTAYDSVAGGGGGSSGFDAHASQLSGATVSTDIGGSPGDFDLGSL